MFHDVAGMHPPAPDIRASTGCALAVLLAFAAPVVAAGKPVVAVLPLRVLGVSAEDARALEKALGDAVAELPEVALAKVRPDGPLDRVCLLGCAITLLEKRMGRSRR